MAAPSIPPALKKVLRFWEIPFLAILAWLMFHVRMLPYDRLIGGDRAYYIGTDPFYHYREVLGGVRAWPSMPRFDPFTHYPHGTGTGQFGSLFDWVASTYIVFTQGTDASEQYVGQVLGAYPAVLGALIIVPFYFLAKRLFGAPGAVVASLTLAVLPGEFLIRSVAGYSDHHVAEALMAVVAILGVFVAAQKAHELRGRMANLRDVKAYWPALAWGALGGLALAAEFYTWPPAILFLAILTLWLTIVMLLEIARGESARGHAVGGATAFAVAGALMLPAVETTYLGEFNTYGLLHPLALFAAAAWLLLIDGATEFLTRRTDQRRAATTVGLSVTGLVVAGFLVVFAVPPAAFAAVGINPGIIGAIRWGLSWITGIGVPRTTLTISEARPAAFFCSQDTNAYSCLSTDFSLVAPFSFLILVGLVAFALWKRRPSDILLALWSIVIFQATRTQIRFSYYLAINMALLVGWLGARVAEAAGFGRVDEEAAAAPAKGTKGRKTRTRERVVTGAAPWRAAAAVVALLLVLPGNVFALRETEKPENADDLWFCRDPGSKPGWETTRCFGPDGDVVMWGHALEWMRDNTPDAGVDLGLIVEAPGPGERYRQSEESYGVLSWWDYGHWMQVLARRPPVANPFQQAAPFASCFFTERDPERAEVMLRQWSSYAWSRPDALPCDELALPSLAETPLPDENPVRYLMIDDEMAAGKFGAITVWAGCDECLPFNRLPQDAKYNTRDQYYRALFKYWKTYREPGGAQHELPWSGEPYRDTMLARLYFDDANTLTNYRLVHELPYGVRIGWVAGFGPEGLFSHNQNEILSERTGWTPAQWAGAPSDLMQPTADGRWIYDASIESSVKTYERVKGAQLVGSGAEPGERVTVTVALFSNTTGREFTWSTTATADAQGDFRATVPYATTAYVPVEQGGTNVEILAQGPALVQTASGRAAQVEIPDIAVLEGQQVAATL